MAIREALKTWPNETDVLRLGALTALGINQVVIAHQRLDEAISRTPMTAEMANIQGRVLAASGDWAAAEDAYNVALKLDSNFVRTRINKLKLLTASEQASRVLDELAEYDGFGDLGELARAQALTDLGSYNEALSVLDKITEAGFKDHVYYQRLKCFSVLGLLEEMKLSFLKIKVDSPLRPKALNIVVNSFEMRGDREASLLQLDDSLKESTPSVNLEAIRLFRRLNNYKEADSKLAVLVKELPQNVEVLCEFANAARLDGRANESCELYKRALSIRPGDYVALSGFSEAAIVAGRLNEAQVTLQAALNQAPNNQFLLALVATLLRASGGGHTKLYNYDKFVRVYDIAPPKGYETVLAFNTALKEKLDALHIYTKAPVNQSLRKGTQTEVDLALIDDPVLNAFFESVEAPVRDYMKNIGQDPAHPLSRRNRGDYRVQGAWSVRLNENGHHVNHVHPMGWLSSAYYIDLPKNMNETDKQGWIKFGEPYLDLEQDAERYVQPKPGRLVLFPSYMWHGTVPFKGPDTRLTLPFDVVPA